jgi:predicted PurR-regulated permease PerM
MEDNDKQVKSPLEKTAGLKLPYYAKATLLLIGFFAFFTILYIAKSIIIPLVFALIISIVLHPVVNFLVRLRINRVVAITITLFLTFLALAAFGSLLFSQAIRFSNSWPILVDKFTAIFNQSISWFSENAEIDPQKIHVWFAKIQGDLININSTAIRQTLVTLGSGIVIFLLLPVYIFLILFYEPLLIEFIRSVFGSDDKSRVSEIIPKIKTVIQRYLIGLLIEFGIMATLEIAALLVLGIEYALLLGIVGALLNVIPYIGGLVAVALPMIVALATKSNPIYAFYVLLIYYFIQLIDNNFIVPKIVASKVKINALFSIIVVLAGNALWGIPGMFLSIPLLAIVKLLFDHIESLKPWGLLLGDTMPPILKIRMRFKKKKD